MIKTGINYFYDFLGLDQSNLKVFYDFTSTSVTGGNKIGSVSNGKELYSGSATTIYSINNSGAFSSSRDNLIKINNISIDDFNSDLSFLIKFRPSISQSSVLFSSLTGDSFKSGFNIGINNSNNLYLEYYDNQGPVILTNQKKLPETSIVNVSISRGNVGLGWYNANSRRMESTNFFINSAYLLFSDKWYLGGNILTGVGNQDFSGYMGGFLAFNTALSQASVTRLTSGFYSYPSVVPAVSGYSVTTGVVDYSYTEIPSYVTGFNSIFSGYRTVGACGETYPVWYDVPVVTQGVPSGRYDPVYGEITGYFEISPEVTGAVINTGLLREMGYDSVTYTWRDIGASSREIYNYTGIETTSYLNKFGNYDFVKGDFSTDSFYQSGNCNVFLNGVFQVESGYVVTGQFFNSGKSGIADFFINNQYIDIKDQIFSSDTLIYDNNNQQNRVIKNNVVDGGFFTVVTIPSGYSELYWNGQKLIREVDYYNFGLAPSGSVNYAVSSEIRPLLIDETFVATKINTNFQRNTGSNSIYGINKFLPDTTNFYLNGIRHPKEHFIEHSWLSPLSGQYIFAENMDLINDNERNDWS